MLDGREPGGDLVVGELDVEAVRLGVDLDDVAVPEDRERAAGRRLGRDVTDGDPLRAAAEPSVREQRRRSSRARRRRSRP